MQPGEKQLGEMQLGEMQHFNTTPLVEIQPGEMQFGEMQLSLPNISADRVNLSPFTKDFRVEFNFWKFSSNRRKNLKIN
ncbi:hypothetical protein H8356DRAFT_1420663 [Neocallimastix lanati (nom. inval.)]|nr:hypothetical protein H8356DRAFT_1420663 [Neocallimastix sp. JGI-2020a]